MRTFLLITALLIISYGSAAQITGSGTLADPYRGINAGNFTISGTKYFNLDIGVSSGTLSLLSGTKLISLNGYASIIISGTGNINVRGSAAFPVTITADSDMDGNIGESTDFWGNLNINSSGLSTINYCIVENGRRARFAYNGGGILATAGNIKIYNSIIRNCFAHRGGGMYILPGATLEISQTLFLNNRAYEHGGAMYLAPGSSPVIASCLFRNNQAQSATLRGGAMAILSSSPKIVNSTFVYNLSTVQDGTSVYLENSPGAKVINTVVWGGTAHIGLSGTPSSVFDVCAIEGVSFTGCLNLSSTNTAPDGPNFTNPAGGDFSLTYVSPLRDSGTDSYPGVTIPPYDIIGSGRVYITDRGAHEMIYSRWHGGSSSWSSSGNWDAGFVPGSTNVIIPSGKPTYPTSAPGPSFTLNAGLEMVLEPGTQATFSSLTNNGRIDVHSDATGIASLLAGSYSGAAGNLNVDLFLRGATPDIDRWHYIAPPATVSKTVFTDIEPENLLGYDESKVVTDVIEGWQWHDGYGGTTPFTNLEARKGYNTFVFEDATLVFSNLKTLTTTLGRIDLPFSGSGLDTSLYGYSLLGNSLTCGINWDMVTFSDANVRDAIYIRTENGEATYINGVGTNGGTAHIPPMQGFFVKTRATGTFLTIPNSAREHNATPRFKSSQQIPLLRLALVSSSSQDEMVIRFEPAATMDFDNEFDAGKIFNPVIKSARLFSVMGNEKYSINSIPWPEKRTVIPLTVINPEAGTFRIRRSQLQAIGNQSITLTDRLAGKSVDLLANSEYSFSAPAGTIADRFTLTISPVEKAAVPEEKPGQEISSLKIYSAAGKVCILPQGPEWDGIGGKVRIFDITGRLLIAENDERFNSGELKEYLMSAAGGLLIVEVTTGPKRYLEKIVLTK